MILRSLLVALRSAQPPTRFLRRSYTTSIWQEIGIEEIEAQIHGQLRECAQAWVSREESSRPRAWGTNLNSETPNRSIDSQTTQPVTIDLTRKGESHNSLESVFDVYFASLKRQTNKMRKKNAIGNISLKKSSPPSKPSKHATSMRQDYPSFAKYVFVQAPSCWWCFRSSPSSSEYGGVRVDS